MTASSTVQSSSSSSSSLSTLDRWAQLKQNAPAGVMDIPKLMNRIEADQSSPSFRQYSLGQGHPNATLLFRQFGVELQQRLAPKGIALPLNILINSPISVGTLANIQDLLAKVEKDAALVKIWGKALARHLQGSTEPVLTDPVAIRAALNDPANARKIQSAITIKLAGMGLKVLPQEIGLFQSLRQIDLRDNKLSALPESLRNLRNLEQLFVCENRLTSLPPFIGNFEKLKALGVCKNPLVKLPEELRNLKSLNILEASDTKLESLPEWIGELNELTDLDLTKTPLTYLPDSIGKLEKLQKLYLEDSFLISLPLSMRNLSSLIDFKLRLTSFAFTFLKHPDDSLRSSLPYLLDRVEESLNYTCQTSFAKLFQALVRNASAEEIQFLFFQLPTETQQSIHEQVNVCPFHEEGSSHSITRSSGNFNEPVLPLDRTILTLTAKTALMATLYVQFDAEQKESVFREIYRSRQDGPIAERLRGLSIQPLKPEQLKWAREHSNDHLLRLIDTIEFARGYTSDEPDSKRLRTL